MKRLKIYWLLPLFILIAAIAVACESTVEVIPPSQPPAEEPAVSLSPVVPPTQDEIPPEEPSVIHPPVEPPVAEALYPDLSDLVNKDPAEVDNSNLPITPVDNLGVTGDAPTVDIAAYRLSVEGLVETPLSLTYESILKYPTDTEVVLLICPFTFADNAEWTGVPVTSILADAVLKPEARKITFFAVDGYSSEMSLEDVQQDGVFLAHTVNGQILPAEHGYPLRLVIKGWYGGHWIKWVERIEVT
ncbi:molybdopterin-dependent oxidoreductase [Chloroflexota bacterium]